jgi:glycosyltransferase involved in cell wall biosynthesis
MRQRVAVNWSVSSFFGWGVYALNLALQWSGDPDIELMSTVPINPDELAVDPVRLHALQPFLALSKALQDASPPLCTARYLLECPVLSDIDLRPGCLDHWITGQPTIGVVFFDTAHLAAEIIARARSLPLIVAGSDWNKRILHEHGIDHVVTVLQGIDPALFHPAPSGGWLGDRFCVFSGGKLEHRKAQDIVLAAFRSFAQRHAEALLVTAWHCPWGDLARSLNVSGLVSPVQFAPGGNVNVVGWAAANGIDPAQILDLGAVPNREMPSILREMDVAVFPIDGDNCFVLDRQTPLDGYGAGLGEVAGWGESSVAEVVEMLELVFADREGARHRGRLAAASMTRLTWKHTAGQLKSLILDQNTPFR